jgi:hypothetical protein
MEKSRPRAVALMLPLSALISSTMNEIRLFSTS